MDDFRLERSDLNVLDAEAISGYQFGRIDDIGVSIIRSDINNDLTWFGTMCKCISDQAIKDMMKCGE